MHEQLDDTATPLLAGLKVLDVGTWIAGPAAATVMADYGAEVIKLESLEGDPLRHLAQGPTSPPCDHNYFWVLDGRNKRSLSMDLKHEATGPVRDALLQWADVLVTNFRPDLAERLGLSWERAKSLNPRLIYAHITGYGDAGPEAGNPGYDTTAWWSRSGLADWVRLPGTRPAMSAPGMGDHATAMALYGAIMTALWARDRTGEGRRVTTSLLANGFWSNGMLASMRLCGAPPPERDPLRPVANALAAQYETQDHRWLQLTLLNEAREWPKLCHALGAEALLEDARFADQALRRADPETLYQALADYFQQLTLNRAKTVLAEAGIPAAILTGVDELAEDPQALAADILTPVADPRPGWTHTVNSPIALEGVKKVAPRYAPALGEHSEAILASLGFSAEAIATLQAAGAVKS